MADTKKVVKGFIVNRPVTLPHTESRSLPPVDEFQDLYGTGGIVQPLYDPDQLSYFLEVSTEHYRAVKAKARDVVGGGWRIRATGEAEGDASHKEILEAFFTRPNETQTLQELFEALLTDYEALGNAYIEVVRHPTKQNDNGIGIPYKLYHLPARFMRIHSSLSMFVQKRGSKLRYFKEFGDTRTIDCDTGEEAKGPTEIFKQATEVIHLKNYHVRADPYGLPDFIPALGAIVGNIAARDYNLAFFSSYAVPAYAIVMKNVDYDDETRSLIEEFFSSTFKGPENAHKTLILQLPPAKADEAPPDIMFKELQRDVRDGSFKEYRISNRDEVYRAHGVPPMIGGIVETGNIGAGTGLAQMQIYKNSVIIPRQNLLMSRINGLLVHGAYGFHFSDFQFELLPPDLGEREQLAKTHEIYLKSGVFTINEVRTDLGLEPVEGGDRPFVPIEEGRLTFLDEIVRKEKETKTKKDTGPSMGPLIHFIKNGTLQHKTLYTLRGTPVAVKDEKKQHILADISDDASQELLEEPYVMTDQGYVIRVHHENGVFSLQEVAERA